MSKSQKGSKFERDMCRLLSKWWSGGKRDDLFWRSAGSGAMAKTRSKVGKKTYGQYGDIAATDPEGTKLLRVFTIELKRGYNKNSFVEMLDKEDKACKQTWEQFFDQVYTDHVNSKSKTWMLIWKKDRRQALVFLPIQIIIQIRKNGAEFEDVSYLKGKISLKSRRRISVFTCTLDDFLKVVKPKYIKRL